MAWTQKMVDEWQIKNKMSLEEINATLQPPKLPDDAPRIGIFLFGQAGDLMEAMGILRYADDLFPNKKLIWFANHPNNDALKYSCVNEVRKWAWAGNGLPSGCPDYDKFLCTSDNRLNLELASQYSDTADLSDGYFPAPHMIDASKREGVEYSNVSKMIFGVPMDWGWHPLLKWSDEEREMVKAAVDGLPTNRRNIMMEVFAGSGQSPFYTSETTRNIIRICREKLGACNFIFGSNKHLGGQDNCGIPNEQFFDDNESFLSCANFTVRQTALFINYCDLMVGISSGVSVSTSAWELKKTPKIQYCGSIICSTSAIALGEFHLVTTDFKTREVADKEFFSKLNEILQTL